MKKKVLLTSMLTIALCLSLIIGSTFALFTSESEVGIVVNSGKVEMIANVESIETWSLEDDKAAAGRTDGSFTQGGSVTFADGILTLDKVIPGDKVAFEITGVNNSNVTIQYRVRIACTEGELLMSGLNVTIGDKTVKGLSTYTSEWAALKPGTNMSPVSVAIELPEDAGNDYQELSSKISVLVQAVQGNAEVSNDQANAGVVVPTQVNAATGKTETTAEAVISANGFVANLPAGTVLNDGATTATLTVTEENASTGSVNFEAVGAETIGLNISIPEVAADNTTPIKITIEGALKTGLSGVAMYHKDALMTAVGSAAEVDADGEFFYDAATGDIILATANFSNFTAVPNSVVVADEAALITAVNKGNNAILAADITLTKTLLMNKSIAIDLNGHTIAADTTALYLLQSSSTYKPSVVIASSKSGAAIDAGDASFGSVILSYGNLEINNVKIDAGNNTAIQSHGSAAIYNSEINVGTVKSSSCTPLNIPGSLTLGEGAVVNVEYLGTSLISGGSSKIVVDGAEINVGTFKVNASPMISRNNATIVELKNSKVNVVLDTTYTSYFINKVDGVTIDGCTFDITDGTATYNVDVVGESYGWVK